MRIKPDGRLPPRYDAATLFQLFRELSFQLNGISEGTIQAFHNASAAMPTSGTYANGDFVKKKPIAEAGGAGAKYVILGWIRLTDGSAHVLNTDWLEARALTGN